MVLANTWDRQGCGPTYYHPTNVNGLHTMRSSRIDYIVIPAAMQGQVQTVKTMDSLGVILQTGNPTGFPKDHIPVSMELFLAPRSFESYGVCTN